ncbi:hypothetical protein EYF80_057263 [Liparis tanakae]|uniref:Uncharacterized protein n=1 Tax=Liparis tanakae TaxID=230148 RepID=A0A4Z2EUH4_9TELE|nr:hypothetical protein EYF80_057263 [Liparis tanakae]
MLWGVFEEERAVEGMRAAGGLRGLFEDYEDVHVERRGPGAMGSASEGSWISSGFLVSVPFTLKGPNRKRQLLAAPPLPPAPSAVGI